jgi:GNAT superfamily N-acetyltransferase
MSSKKVCIRVATFGDVLDWNSNNNLVTRPNIGTLWKKLIHVADNCSGCIVAYLLSEGEEEEEGNDHFSIASLFVHHTYRKRGIATDLITAAQNTMEKVRFVSLFCYNFVFWIRFVTCGLAYRVWYRPFNWLCMELV